MFPEQLVQELCCRHTSNIGAGTALEKDDFLCKHAMVFHLDGFLQGPYCYAAVQELVEENALCDVKCHQQHVHCWVQTLSPDFYLHGN